MLNVAASFPLFIKDVSTYRMQKNMTRKQTLLFVLTWLLSVSTTLISQVSGLNDPTFNPGDFGLGNGDGANGSVWSSAIQSDGKIVIGGEFTRYNGTAINRIARLNSDGTLDPTFNVGTGADIGIRKVALQSDGKIIICGSFTSYNGISANRIARLNANGTLDASFNTGTGFDNAIYALAIQNDGKIIVGGLFTQCNGTAANRIVRLNTNGSIDASYLCSGADNQVSSLALQADGKLIVGGAYSFFNGAASNKLVRLNSNGTTDNLFVSGSGSNGVIRSISTQADGKIILGGVFTSYNGTLINRVARLNTDGSLDGSFATGTGPNNSVIWSSAVQADGKIIIGGDFTSYNGTASNRIIRLNANGTVDAAFTAGSGASGFVLTLSLQTDGKIITGGDIATYDGITCNHITRLHTNGSIDPTFNAGTSANNSMHAIALQTDGKIIAGGAYTRYSGTLANRISRLNSNGSLDASFATGTGMNDTVLSVSIQPDGKVITAGAFTNYNGTPASRIIRLQANGTADASFTTGSGFNGSVYATALQSDGKLIVGGNFTTYNGTAVNRIARLNANGTLDAGFAVGSGANHTVYAIAIQSDGKIIIAGEYTTYNGAALNRVARLNANGSVDPAFGTGSGAGNTVYSALIQADGKIVLGGDFLSYNGISAFRLVRLNSNGTTDNSFNSGTGPASSVLSMSLQNDGKLIIGGIFSTYNGSPANRLARLNTNGTLDASFNVGAGAVGIPFLTNGNVYATAIQADSKVIIAGGFVSYHGVGRNRIARTEVCDGADVISGPTSACVGSIQTYSVSPVAGAGSYNWSLPSGWSGSSTSNTISVAVANSGSISVSVNRTCGLTGANTLSVIAEPLPVVTAPCATICTGESYTIVPSGANTYTYSGGSNVVAPTTSTTYTVSGTGANGCEHFALSHISVNALPAISAPNGIACTGSSYTIVPSGAVTYTYSGGNPVVVPASISNYTIAGTNANGCINSTVITVSVNPLPNIQITTNGTLPLCIGTTATLTASGGTSYSWYGNGPTVATNTIAVTPTVATSYTLAGTDVNGCTNYAFFNQSVSALPTVQVSASHTVFCAGVTTTLSATGGLTYSWYPNGPVGTMTHTLATSPTVTTTYTVEGTDANGCKNYATTSTTVHPLPVIQVSPAGVALCTGDTRTLTASGGIVYDWYPDGPLGTGSSSVVISPTVSTTYTIEGTDAHGCKNSATTSATVHTLPVIQVSPNTIALCAGETVTLTANGGIGYDWYPNGPVSINTNSIVVSPTVSTTYTVEGSDSNNCKNTATASVTINSLPTIQVSSSHPVICEGQSAVLTATGGSLYNWFPAGPIGNGSGTITVSPTVTTTYTVEGTDNQGCSNQTIITQSVSLCTGMEAVSSNVNNILSVFPNPASTVIYVQTSSAEPVQLSITDMLGKTVHTERVTQDQQSITIEHLSAGLYTIKAEQKHQIQIIRFIKN